MSAIIWLENRLRDHWRYRALTRHDLGLLLVLGLLIFSSGIGLKDPWPPDEPRFALIAEEMVAVGEWLLPHRASELYADKPPIFFWMVAAVYATTGSLRVAHLLPSLLASLLTLLLVYDLGRRLWHRRVGLASALALLLVAQFPLHAKTGQIDAVATFWTTLGLNLICRHLLLGPNWRAYAAAGVVMGLGVITKGIGFLPLLILLPWGWARGRGWPGLDGHRLADWRWLLAPLGLILAASLWLAPILLRVATTDDAELTDYRHELLWEQTAERYTSLQGHQKPIWFYPGSVIPILWQPLVLTLPWLLPAWWRRLRRRDPRYLVLLVWIFLIVLFFTFSAGKRGVYILPATPAFALAAGPLLAGLTRLPSFRRLVLSFALALASIFAVVGGAGLAGREWTRVLEMEIAVSPWWLLFVLGLIGLGWAMSLRRRSVVMALYGFWICAWLGYGWWGYPLLDPVRSSGPLMQRVSEHIGPFAELAMVGWKEQNILHADRPVTHWGFVPDHRLTPAVCERQARAAAAWLSDEQESRWLLTSERCTEPCFDPALAADLGVRHRRRWFLLDRSALAETCASASTLPSTRAYRTNWRE